MYAIFFIPFEVDEESDNAIFHPSLNLAEMHGISNKILISVEDITLQKKIG
jgi:hypothetical protein